MKRYDPRLWLGVLLVFGGVLSLLGRLGVISEVGDIFWGIVFGGAGVFFLYMTVKDRANWWTAFPAFTFLGLAASNLLPESLAQFDGIAFLGVMSIAFWWIYFTDKSHWWAIIPGGVLLSIGLTDTIGKLMNTDTGGLFFLGLGLTFILVAILPGGGGRSWAFVPGMILLIFGSIIGSPAVGALEYVWPAVLIVVGLYFVYRFFRNQSMP